MPDETVLRTERLSLRKITAEDAAFVLEVLNDPSFLRHIGDRKVRSIEDAVQYIAKGPQASYEKNGFGMWLVELKDSGEPIGICGLVKRDVLEDVDIGYAFLPRFWSKGYALESTTAVQRHAFDVIGVPRLLAVVNADNERSIRVLEKIGMKYERMVRLAPEEHEIRLYASIADG